MTDSNSDQFPDQLTNGQKPELMAEVIELDVFRASVDPEVEQHQVDTGSRFIDVAKAQDDPADETLETRYSRGDITRLLDITPLQTKKLTDELMKELPDSFYPSAEDESQLECTYEIVNLVSEQLPAPKDWTTAVELAEELGADKSYVRRLMTRLAEVSDLTRLRLHLDDKDESRSALHMSPEVADDIRAYVDTVGLQTKSTEGAMIDEFETIKEDVQGGLTLEAREFNKLVSLFGPESATDLFYHMFPGTRKLPTGHIRSFLSDYLGAFTVVRGHLDFEYLSTNSELLSQATFREALVEVVKKDCLAFYHKTARKNPAVDELDVVFTYLDKVRSQVKDFENKDLGDVISEVEDYYFSLFDNYGSYSGVVDSLRSDRPFPDLNQRINVKEICEKKRMLIADDPGLGKSGSAILAKEKLGAKTAVIVAPSSVLDKKMWQTYLSDQLKHDGSPAGYFTNGNAPRVLVVDGPSALDGVVMGDFDYVLISQEKLNESYNKALCSMGFDMLIIDEAHKLKNLTDGQRATRLIELSDHLEGRDNTYTVMLTATPAPNKVSDIAMAMRLLYPQKFAHLSNKDLAYMMINGDVRELRGFLLPRMQMKKIEDCVDIPPLDETVHYIEISEAEADLQRLNVEDDELDFSTKIQTARKMLLNPATVDVFPTIVPSKAIALNNILQESFVTSEKVVIFVNDFKEEVLTGKSTIEDFLTLPDDVSIRWIHGDTEIHKERYRIQQEFQDPGSGRILLIVNGMVTDVGVDFSAADEAIIYNEGWTVSEKRQEIGRCHRPGRTKSLKVHTLIAAGTVETAMHQYAKKKESAISKLLYGVPLSELEQNLLKAAEDDGSDSLASDVNPELATYYFSELQLLNRMIAKTKQQGEVTTRRMIDVDGPKYARVYSELTGRSYQANMARLTGSVVESLIAESVKPQDPRRIIDLGSGPEMLKRHISEQHVDRVVSIDLNRHHFVGGSEQPKAIVGSIVSAPIASKSADIVTMGLVLDGTKYLPSKRAEQHDALERLEILKEVNRILKPNGHAVITLIYSLDIASEASFERLVRKMGLQVVSHFSGMVTSDNNDPRGRIITLKKIKDCPDDMDALVNQIGSANLKGLKFAKRNARVKDPKKIDRAYKIRGKNRITPRFNSYDQSVADEEAEILSRMENLRSRHGSIIDIPEDAIIAAGFARARNNRTYVLFRRLGNAAGAVFLKDKVS